MPTSTQLVVRVYNLRRLHRGDSTVARQQRLLLRQGQVPLNRKVVCLDEDGRPLFNALLFGRAERCLCFVAFRFRPVGADSIRGIVPGKTAAPLVSLTRRMLPWTSA